MCLPHSYDKVCSLQRAMGKGKQKSPWGATTTYHCNKTPYIGVTQSFPCQDVMCELGICYPHYWLTDQVNELAHNPSRLGGAHLCTRLLHLVYISFPSGEIILGISKGLLWRGRVDELWCMLLQIVFKCSGSGCMHHKGQLATFKWWFGKQMINVL